MTDAYRQTVEEAADLLEICAAGGSPGATRLLPLADALRTGLAPALERAREEERERWHRMIDGQLEVARQGINSHHPSDRLIHHHAISILTHIRDTWPLPAPPPPATETQPTPAEELKWRTAADQQHDKDFAALDHRRANVAANPADAIAALAGRES
jgi:hypothetical protein